MIINKIINLILINKLMKLKKMKIYQLENHNNIIY